MAMPSYSVLVGWSTALGGVLVFDKSRFTNAAGLLPEGGEGDVFSNAFTQFFDGPNDDITADVESVRISRGRDSLLDDINAGTCELVIRRADDLSYWNPANAASPINADNSPGFVPMRPVQVTATYDDGTGPVAFPMFRGFIRSARHDPDSGQTSVQAVDLFLWLTRAFPVSVDDFTNDDRGAADDLTSSEASTVTFSGTSSTGFLRSLVS
jgi:hypothetical protein